MNHRDPSAPVFDGLIERLQLRLNEDATAATREWWTKYLKGTASFRGVKMADVREAVHAWFEEERLREHLSAGQQKDLALLLLEEDFTEDKLAGVLFLKEILLPAGVLDCGPDLPRFARLFDRGHIRDWGTCDWFCVKVLGPLVTQQGEACASHFRLARRGQLMAAPRLRRRVRQPRQAW
jgi:3-methyladenine DNA glycosylase AlkD